MKCIKVHNGYVLASAVVAVIDQTRMGSKTGNCLVSVAGHIDGGWDNGGSGTADSAFVIKNTTAEDLRDALGWHAEEVEAKS